MVMNKPCVDGSQRHHVLLDEKGTHGVCQRCGSEQDYPRKLIRTAIGPEQKAALRRERMVALATGGNDEV